MSLKAGRVGVNPADVDPISGHVSPNAIGLYTKAQADDKFFDRSEQNILGAKNFVKSCHLTTNKTQGSNAVFMFAELLPDTEYILSFDTSNVSDYLVNSYLTDYATSGVLVVFVTKSGRNSVKFKTASVLSKSDTAQYNATYGWRLLINHSANDNAPDLTNVMLRLASDPDDTYENYSMTNKELTAKVDGIIDAVLTSADFAGFKTKVGSL